MNTTRELIDIADKYGAKNYLPLPVVLNWGRGSRVRDVDGREYLDFLSCYSALNFGHQHPSLVGALTQQATQLAVCSRAFMSEQLCLFERELAQFCEMDCVLPMNSGTEAVETALKIARKWGQQKKGVPPEKNKIIAMRNNFHGRTITVVSFSTEDLYRNGYGPFTPGFSIVDFGDAEALEKCIDENTIAVLMEPIQAEAGILIPQAGYLSKVRELCTANNVLLMFDEIQTGLGRTGRDFCFQHEAARPDLLILGKSLGGGLLPLSAVLAPKSVMDVIRPGEHGSTFGGNPLACAVGREAVRILREEKLSARSEELGKKAMARLRELSFPQVKEIRGKGLLIGIELKGSARPYCEKLAERGVLCKETHDTVIRIAPPLTISEKDLMDGVEKVTKVLADPS
ncbi:MAG: ornithine--oxo-acid transaminase [Bdellovibrionaceae bacterium]|nr:ornithine--oxo-acid transaminase [Bdellovibrionales bacterium]MCB9253151.1 ornithine--oxo-acid transaminase [Pseudobdellovibrionaceae bacterium]